MKVAVVCEKTDRNGEYTVNCKCVWQQGLLVPRVSAASWRAVT